MRAQADKRWQLADWRARPLLAEVLRAAQHLILKPYVACARAQADKRWQLADWRMRPLSAEMLRYARMDTHFLLYIYDRLRVRARPAKPHHAVLGAWVPHALSGTLGSQWRMTYSPCVCKVSCESACHVSMSRPSGSLRVKRAKVCT